MRRQLISLGLCIVLVYVASGFACSKAQIADLASDVVDSIRIAAPSMVAAGISQAKIDLALTAGQKLVDFANGTGTGDITNLTATLINNFNSLADMAGVLSDPAQRTRILAYLAVGSIALNLIAKRLRDSVPSNANIRRAPNGQVGIIARQANVPNWRCRSSQSGRFEKMDYCKAHPDVSTVERF